MAILASRYVGLYAIAIIGVFLLYAENLSDAYKGEMWELLYVWTLPLGAWETMRRVSEFVCFGAGRFQPLAFFVPYLQATLGGISFVESHLFALGLHLLCGSLSAVLSYRWLRDAFLSFCVFSAFLFAYLASDVLIWTFFTYIQVHAFLLLASIGLFVAYLRKERRSLLFLSWATAVVSAFLYESGIAVLLAQPAFAIVSGRALARRRFVLEIVCPGAIFAAYLGAAFLTMSLDYRDSSAQLHWMMFPKLFTYLLYYLRYNAGFRADADIYNIASLYGLGIDLTAWNVLGIGLLILFIASIGRTMLRGWSALKISASPELWFTGVVLGGYVLLMAFGRVPKGSTLFTPSGLETQFRYYYVSSLLVPLLLAIAVGRAAAGHYAKLPLVGMLSFMVLGNTYNILRFGEHISLATAPVSAHSLRVIGELSGDADLEKKFVRRMHRDWVTESIPTPRQYRAHTFNANQCLPHPEYARVERNVVSSLVITQPGPIRGESHLAKLSEVDLKDYRITDSSSHPLAQARHAATGAGVWHAMHIPQPPQTVWMEVDFGRENPRRIVALGFIPRPGHPEQFWDEAVWQGSSDGGRWEEIASFKLTAPPAENLFVMRFSNDRAYRHYRLFIKGGFAGGRFLALGAIKMYEAEGALKE